MKIEKQQQQKNALLREYSYKFLNHKTYLCWIQPTYCIVKDFTNSNHVSVSKFTIP